MKGKIKNATVSTASGQTGRTRDADKSLHPHPSHTRYCLNDPDDNRTDPSLR